MVVAALIGWPAFLYSNASSKLEHIEALSDAPATAGTTYLIAGSDRRGDEGGIAADGTEGERTDSMILIHKADNGVVSVVSLPRDADVKIPGHKHNKLNAAFSYGGAPLLVSTVEQLTGMKVDHFAIVGMGGVSQIVDAIGGVNLCLDYDVNDQNSALNWKSGCHDVDGPTALAFARMRYADPRGDIGRQERQRQVIAQVVKKATSPSTLINPASQYRLSGAGAQTVRVDHSSGLMDLAHLVFAYRSASQANLLGTPPIKNLNYRAGHGSSVQLDPELAPQFFKKVKNGSVQPGDFNQYTGK
ncbi:transcriptional regulator [Boudabousia marimammalium]|uniref:Transcriptional regulator n=1 Tax=Boudabousia marimammalium TaxID=156892 RepID=A0A1Q5PS15_9ACTO|nr:transcriptional regulator [Boudabousia marimammalium]